MFKKAKLREQQDTAEVTEICKRLEDMKTPQHVCDVLSEIVSTGVEKALETNENAPSYKDFALILSHKVKNSNWAHITPPLADVGLDYTNTRRSLISMWNPFLDL